ncbi:MAG: hypothetical protein ACKVP1_12020, partial [Burkholderiaceae bacterium]
EKREFRRRVADANHAQLLHAPDDIGLFHDLGDGGGQFMDNRSRRSRRLVLLRNADGLRWQMTGDG